MLEVRIKIIQRPTITCIDGMQLDRYVPGVEYEVGSTLGAYLLAEGWAEPVSLDPPVVLAPPSEFRLDEHEFDHPPNLERDIYPPYYDGPPIAADRRRTRRR